jgi:hypothetical protein
MTKTGKPLSGLAAPGQRATSSKPGVGTAHCTLTTVYEGDELAFQEARDVLKEMRNEEIISVQ